MASLFTIEKKVVWWGKNLDFSYLMKVLHFVFYVTFSCNNMLVLYKIVLLCVLLKYVDRVFAMPTLHLLIFFTDSQINGSMQFCLFLHLRFCDTIYYEKFHNLLRVITYNFIKLSCIRWAFVDWYKYITKCYYPLIH